MYNYREIRKEEVSTYLQMEDYAFALEKGPKSYSEDEIPKVIGERRGLFRGSDLLCCYLLYVIECRVRGTWFKVGAIGDVASPPENRRKGYVGEMLRRALKEMKERGMAFSALWPFSYPFYRSFGWEQSSAFQSYTLELKFLKFTANDTVGEFRKVSIDDYQLLNSIYRQFYNRYDLEIKRSRDWWKDRVFRTKNKRYGYIWEKEGEARGYIIYFVQAGKDNFWERKLYVPELLAVDYEAYRQLLRFIYYHDSQIIEAKINAPLDNPLLKVLPDPRIKKHQYEPGIMFRIVDLVKVLNSLVYAEDLQEKITFTVKDEQADWNNGDFILEVEGGRGRCRKKNLSGETDFQVNIHSFAPVITGFMDPEEAAALNYLNVKEPGHARTLNRIFPARKTFFCEFF